MESAAASRGPAPHYLPCSAAAAALGAPDRAPPPPRPPAPTATTTPAASSTSCRPGQGQSVNAAEIGAFLADRRPAAARPATSCRCTRTSSTRRRGCRQSQLADYFKDASFGVEPAERRAHLQPARRRHDRPRRVRRPAHLRRRPRRRDVRRRLHRRRGPDVLHRRPAPRRPRPALLVRRRLGGNGEMDQSVWADTPYERRASSRSSTTSPTRSTAPAGVQVAERRRTATSPGSTSRIAEIRANPLLMPGEYAAARPARSGPDDWKVTDVISIASLVAGIFGKGGGNEVGSALVLEAAQKRFGKRAGKQVWTDFRSRQRPRGADDDPRHALPLHAGAAEHAKAALPDPGTVQRSRRGRRRVERGRSTSDTGRDVGELPDVGDLLGGCGADAAASNALLVSERESEGGDADRRLRPAGLLLHAADPDRAGDPRPGRRRRARRSTPAAPPSRAPTSTSSSATAATTPGRRPRRARTSSTPSRSRSASRTASKPTHRLDALPLPRPLPADRRARAGQHAGRRQRRRHDAVGLGDAARRAHAARDRHPPGRDQAASPTPTRKLRATYYHEVDSALGFADFNNPERDGVAARVHARRPARSTTRSTGSTSTPSTSPTSTPASTRSRSRRTDPNFPALAKPALHRGATPTTELSTSRTGSRCSQAPPGGRPALPHELEQQAGARLPRLRRPLQLAVTRPRAAAGRPDRGRDPRDRGR